jgi:hypothetical protein
MQDSTSATGSQTDSTNTTTTDSTTTTYTTNTTTSTTTTYNTTSSHAISHVLCVAFHHRNGPQLEYSYPQMTIPDQWSFMVSLSHTALHVPP